MRNMIVSLYSVIGDFFMILRLFKNVVFKQRIRKTQNIFNVTYQSDLQGWY